MIRLNNGTPDKRNRWNRKRVSNLAAAVAAIMLFASTQVNLPAGSQAGTDLSIVGDLADQESLSADQSAGIGERDEDDSRVVSVSTRKNRGLKLSLFKFRR